MNKAFVKELKKHSPAFQDFCFSLYGKRYNDVFDAFNKRFHGVSGAKEALDKFNLENIGKNEVKAFPDFAKLFDEMEEKRVALVQ